VSFDFVGLGYKTKWTDIDYRFEWSPLMSFVFFGYQITVIVESPEYTHYWESWLYYENNISKLLSKEERIKRHIKEFPLIYKRTSVGKTETINYYEVILKDSYLKFINES